MVKLLVTALILLIPAWIYTSLVRSADRYEKEPVAYLIYAFLWGAVPAVIFALILQIGLSLPVALFLGADSLGAQLVETSIGAPVTEEFLKAIAVAIIYISKRREFDGWVDGMVYGAMAGFGFAYVENILYLMGTASTEEWITLFVLRTIVFGGLHGFWTAIVGIGFGFARYMANPLGRVITVLGALLIAMVLHLIHNGAVVLVEATAGVSFLVALLNYGVLLVVMLLLWWVAARVDRAKLRTYLADEVPSILPRSLYEAICNPGSRKLMRRLGLNADQQRQIIQTSAELAQKKLQFAKMGNESGNREEISQLRSQLQQLSRS
ncbi:MAG: PrsW family intramembrane metalloprotease [Cyanobacteria bacterium P01_H01_bin.119]